MEISVDLKDKFEADGFSISGTIDGLAGDFDTISVPDVPIDSSSLETAIEGLKDTSASEVLGAVQVILDAIGATGLEIPMLDDIVGPLESALALGEEIAEATETGWFTDVLDSGSDISGVGLEALLERIGAVADGLEGPGVSAGISLLESLLPESIDLDGTLSDVRSWIATAKILISAIAGLMGTEGSSREIGEGVGLVLTMMRPSEIGALTGRLATWSGRNLADLLVGVDASDPALAALIAPAILEMTADIRVATDALARGLGFGQATLVGIDIPGLEAKLTAASNLLLEDGLDGVRSVAEQLVSFAQPVLGVTLPEPAASLEDFIASMTGRLGAVGSAIEGLDPNRLSGAVTQAVQPIVDVVTSIRAAAEEVVVLARSAFDAVDQLIEAIDLTAITEAINALLAPVREVLDAITAVISDAEAAIGAVSDAVVDAMAVVRSSAEAAAQFISDAFGRVEAVLAAINVAEIQANIERGLAPIADTLASARVKPFFDTANDVIDTTATVVGAVPLGLLPDDAKADLAEAVRPVKAIDFQRDVADVLNDRMDEILETLDTTILADIDRAYQDMITFLSTIDPATPIAEFEATVFDPFLEELRKVNPEEILQPIEAAIGPVQQAIADFSLDDELLAPIESALDGIAAQLLSLSPADLIAPLQTSLDELRANLVAQLRLDELEAWIDTAEETVAGWFDRIDPAQLADALDGAYASIVAEAGRGPTGVGLGGSFIASMMQGAGLTMRTDSFDTVVSWIRGEVGSTVVSDRVRTAAEGLSELRDAVAAVDVAGLVADLQPEWRAVHEATLALPEDSVLRVSIELEIGLSEPQVLLTPFVQAQQEYVEALGEATAALGRLAGSERSNIDAVAMGLRDALRPLAAFPEWIRSLLSRFGLDASGPTMREMLIELMSSIRPSDILAPLVSSLEVLVSNFQAAASSGLLAPARTIVTDVRAALDAIDIGFITTELDEVFAEVAAKIDGLRPSVALGPTLTSLTDLQTELADFDPLGPVRVAADAITGAIEDGAETLRPSVIFAPATDIYDTIIGLVGALNVRALLDPLLTALEGIAADLGEGLDSLAVSLKKLQDALPDADNLASGGTSGSVSVSAGLG